MQVGKSTKIWHIANLLGHCFYSVVSGSNTFVHTLLEGSHLGLHLLNGLFVAIVSSHLLLSKFSGRSGSELGSLLGKVLLDGSLTSLKLLLEFSSLNLSLGNSLDVFAIGINGWVLKSVLFLLPLLLNGSLLCLLSVVSCLLNSGHFSLVWV